MEATAVKEEHEASFTVLKVGEQWSLKERMRDIRNAVVKPKMRRLFCEKDESGKAGTVQILRSTRAAGQLQRANQDRPRVIRIRIDSVAVIEGAF